LSNVIAYKPKLVKPRVRNLPKVCPVRNASLTFLLSKLLDIVSWLRKINAKMMIEDSLAHFNLFNNPIPEAMQRLAIPRETTNMMIS
jgi:hypothetical protein